MAPPLLKITHWGPGCHETPLTGSFVFARGIIWFPWLVSYRSLDGATGAMAAKAMMADVMMVRNMALSSVDGKTLGAIRFAGCDTRHVPILSFGGPDPPHWIESTSEPLESVCQRVESISQ
jgi:hypothetical protein